MRPHLPARVEIDSDNNRIGDRLDRKVGEIRSELAREKNAERRRQLAEQLASPVEVEVVFTEQVSQKQIDDFLALGGSIDHVYRAVSYGWIGSVPAASLDALSAALGDSLLVVTEVVPAQLHMDEATRTGRVRPIWAPGFAGVAGGLSGTSDITIGVIDSGVDDSHPDLAGRVAYWKDYTTDNEATPRDVIQHGSHVAGIALGNGNAFGSATGTLKYTDSGNLAGVPANSFFLSGIHVPSAPMTYDLSSTWLGGGSTILRVAARTNGVSGGFISICATTSGGSPRTLDCVSNGNTSQMYSSALPQSSTGSIGRYATTVSVSPYPGVGDGFNAFRGVAPGAKWAGAKVFTNAGSGSSATIGAAMDDLVAKRSEHKIKVVNMSLGMVGNPGVDATIRAKANSMVASGIVVVASAGNDGPGTAPANTVDDPGRAALVLTVGASNDANALTRYTSSGFTSPAADEDFKPDLLAPGGSDYYSQILSVDSNDADAESSSFADRVRDDYLNIKGTSMAAPFAAGSAALVVDAMQRSGTSWSFASSAQPLFVKMLLCASSTETNASRETSAAPHPTLGRSATPKDLYEGYGIMNPDAAVEAVLREYSGGNLSDSTAGGAFDRRAWGRRLAITSGPAVTLTLTVPADADYDLYLYSGTPDAKGNPVVRAASTNAGAGADESITFTPTSTETRYLFVKRVSGSGEWSLSSGTAQDTCGDGNKTGGEQCDDGNQLGGDCCSAECRFETNGSPCNDGLFCTATDTCSSGVCSGTGNPCAGGGECNDSCNEATDSCADAAGTPCTSDSNPCTLDQCNGQGGCTHPAGNAGTVCRATSGSCDVAESCNGTSTSCPADAYALAATPCRASAGVCDPAETCTGGSPACPADQLAGSGTVCRAASGVCDIEERCSGASAACPANVLASSATVCRASAGVCDAEERCSGASASCPANGFSGTSTVCRAASGACDAAETCTGTSASCPVNAFASTTTVCRAASGVCDAQETCTGTSGSCPADSLAPTATVCRAAAGVCDTEETCTGTSPTCPANGFASTATACRPASGVCDAEETCTGTSATCPANAFASTATACRASAGVCDAEETCTGTSATCPSDAFASTATSCRAASGVCDAVETCTGTSATCPPNTFAPTTTVCRSASGICDVEETCSGTSAACPANAFASAAVVCRATSGVCDAEETCTGTSAVCPANAFASTAVTCRASSGVCDAEETCTGTSAACPANAFASAAVTCRASSGVCDAEETCTGTSAACPANAFASAAVTCRASSGVCDAEETCTGTSAACPANAFASTAVTCRASSGVCDVQENCTGSSATCPADGFAATATTCRNAIGICDVAEACTGTSASCPVDAVAEPTIVCRASAGECDVAETCNGTTKTCPVNSFVEADTPCSTDADECTLDVCTGLSATCQHPSSGVCENCGDGVLHDGEACDDGNTADGDCCSSTCTSAANDGVVCDDGIFCNGADACAAGACAQHAGDPCDGPDADGDCSESCDEVADGCTAPDPDGTACNDGGFCNGSDTCSEGECAVHSGNPCTGADGDDDCTESCNEAADDCNAADPDGSACDDGLPCSTDDACNSGVCGAAAASALCASTTTTTLPAPACGDTNGDERITASDAQFALRAAVGSAECAGEICDFNGDGRVAAGDSLLILRTAVGQEVEPKCPGTPGFASMAAPTSTVTTTTVHDAAD